MAPIMPEAPTLFSTAMLWPSTRAATLHRARMDWSAVPPAGQGQMKVMERSGQVWAERRLDVAVSAVALNAPSTSWRRPMRGVCISCLRGFFNWLHALLRIGA